MFNHSLLLLPIAMFLATNAGAQDQTVEKTVKVRTGEMKQIGVYGRITPDCVNGKVNVRLAEKPLSGSVTARPATLPRGAIPKCPDLIAKSAVIFYQSDPGFLGNDRAVVEVEAESGQLERHEFTIVVE